MNALSDYIFSVVTKCCGYFLQRRWTPLIQASHSGKKGLVKLLLDYGADPDFRAGVIMQIARDALLMVCDALSDYRKGGLL